MPSADFVTTGIAGFDSLFQGGGIRRGNVVLVEGEAGSGKTLLGMEFVYRGALELDEPGIIVMFESEPEMILRDAAAMGWQFEPLLRANRLKILHTSPQVLEQELRTPDSVLLQTAKQMNARRIFIDTIGLLEPHANGGNGNGKGSYRGLLHQFMDGLRRERLTALVADGTGALAANPQVEMAEFLADTVVRLRRGRNAEGVYRRLEIVKSRGQSFDAGEHTLAIEGGRGLVVFRRVQSEMRERLKQPSPQVRHSAAGVPALDALFGGGLLDGSVTLIIGNSGSGKSILGYQIALEGARARADRSLIVSADEHPAQLMRNAALAGLPLREQVEAGNVHLLSVSPLELEVDVHYAQICGLIEAHGIRRLIIDGLSAMRQALHDERRFRELMHAVMAFTKQRSIVTFLCYEHPELFGMTRFMPDAGISSIVDNIVLLTFVELGQHMRRAITVAKARGCDHPLATHEFRIGKGGIQLVPGSESGAIPAPFGQYLNLLSRAPTRFPAKP
jgi:circadian clock protein KaiC